MKRIIRASIFSFMLAGVLVFAGCVEETETDTGMLGDDGMIGDTLQDTTMQGNSATVQLQPTEGNNVSGSLTFTQVGDTRIQIQGQITGLEPGLHGLHVHENGDCSAPDASSAGGHFNPAGATHGGPDAPAGQRHVGDLGNIEADSTGTAVVDITDELIALEGTNSIVGKAMVVHAGEDDLTTDPSGESGARVACGVIESQGMGGM